MKFSSCVSSCVAMTAFCILIASPVYADPDKPRHGGVVAEVRHVSYELVAKPGEMAVHITDHGKPVPTAGVKASATLLAGGEKSTIEFAPAGDNRLAAKGAFKAAPGTQVLLSVTYPGKTALAVRFVIK